MLAIFLCETQEPRGHPSFFLLLAPPSVASLALAGFNGGAFDEVAHAVYGLVVLTLVRPSAAHARAR